MCFTADQTPLPELHKHQWRRSGSNRQPLPCKGSALPIELRPLQLTRFTGILAGMGVRGLEPRTSALSELRSNHLSYTPRILNIFGGGHSGNTLTKCPVIGISGQNFLSFESLLAGTLRFTGISAAQLRLKPHSAAPGQPLIGSPFFSIEANCCVPVRFFQNGTLRFRRFAGMFLGLRRKHTASAKLHFACADLKETEL